MGFIGVGSGGTDLMGSKDRRCQTRVWNSVKSQLWSAEWCCCKASQTLVLFYSYIHAERQAPHRGLESTITLLILSCGNSTYILKHFLTVELMLPRREGGHIFFIEKSNTAATSGSSW